MLAFTSLHSYDYLSIVKILINIIIIIYICIGKPKPVSFSAAIIHKMYVAYLRLLPTPKIWYTIYYGIVSYVVIIVAFI